MSPSIVFSQFRRGRQNDAEGKRQALEQKKISFKLWIPPFLLWPCMNLNLFFSLSVKWEWYYFYHRALGQWLKHSPGDSSRIFLPMATFKGSLSSKSYFFPCQRYWQVKRYLLTNHCVPGNSSKWVAPVILEFSI